MVRETRDEIWSAKAEKVTTVGELVGACLPLLAGDVVKYVGRSRRVKGGALERGQWLVVHGIQETRDGYDEISFMLLERPPIGEAPRELIVVVKDWSDLESFEVLLPCETCDAREQADRLRLLDEV